MKNWAEWIGKHDMYWEVFPNNWTEAPFLGNGCIGVQVFHNKENKSIHLELGRNDMCDTRQEGVPGFDVFFRNPRLQIGAMELGYKGVIKKVEMRLDLYRAQLHGKLETHLGEIKFKILVHSREMLVITFFEGIKGEAESTWKFVPAKAVSPRQQYGIENNEDFRIKKDYKYYDIPPKVRAFGRDGYSRQLLENGYENVVGWKELVEEEGKRCLLVSLVQGKAGTIQEIQQYLDSFNRMGGLLKEHYAWWANYYQKSNISIPDKALEDFYWIQLYKLACVTRDRENAVVVDNQGPWLCCSTPWPATWWNLNVQLSYLSCYVTNHTDLSKSLSEKLKKCYLNLINNVPEEFRYDSAGIGTMSDLYLNSHVRKAGIDSGTGFRELGNLTWVMHNCWIYYQVTMDHEYLKELIYPVLRRCVNYYIHFLERKEDGYYHLLETSSPEYGIDCKDCNYDLALLRFGCKTLQKCVEILGINDEKEELWKDILLNLVPYPVDETGFMIGADLPYTYSHRHFSHLMMIYLHEVTVEDKDMLPIMRKSIEHWWSKPEKMAGFSCTVASLLWSALGEGDNAIYYLKKLWSGKYANLLPNTLYKEDGPVIETPLSVIQCVVEMLIQSHNGVIRIFPAVPSEWKDVSFDNMLAQGGFSVSAILKNESLYCVKIQSMFGSKCIMEAHNLENMNIADEKIKQISANRIEIMLEVGEEIVIQRK